MLPCLCLTVLIFAAGQWLSQRVNPRDRKSICGSFCLRSLSLSQGYCGLKGHSQSWAALLWKPATDCFLCQGLLLLLMYSESKSLSEPHKQFFAITTVDLTILMQLHQYDTKQTDSSCCSTLCGTWVLPGQPLRTQFCPFLLFFSNKNFFFFFFLCRAISNN